MKRLRLAQVMGRDAKRIAAIDSEIPRVIAWTLNDQHPSVVRLRTEREACARRIALIREGHAEPAA